MAKFDFNKPVASFSWYLQNGSADDKRGNRLHVGTGQKAQIYFDPESGEFIGKLKYVDDYIDLADGAKQHFELPRTAREYKPSDFSPKFPISNVKFEVDESVKDFIHVLPRGLFFYQNEFYDAVFGDKTDYLMTASEVCKKTLGMLEPEPPQPAKTKNLSQKTMSSREASNRLSDEIGVKPCTRDEGTVGDS